MRRFVALDGIRGLALLLVIFFHTIHIDTTSMADDLYIRVARGFRLGVELFFVLSGFLITGILYASKRSEGYFRNFYARRALRIFPLYYAVVAFCVLAPMVFPMLRSNDIPILPYGGLNYWLYLSNIWETGPHPILGVAWSLAIEEQFYLLWPLLICYLDRRGILNAAWACVGTGLVYRILVEYGNLELPRLALPARVDMLAMGAIAAIAVNTSASQLKERTMRSVVILAWGILAAAVVYERGVWGHAVNTFGMTAMGVIFTGWIMTVVHFRPHGRLADCFSVAWLRCLGKYSYAMYFLHSPLDAVLRRLVDLKALFLQFPALQLPINIAYTCLVTILSLGCAMISWHAFEKHFLKLKDRFDFPGESNLKCNAPVIIAKSP